MNDSKLCLSLDFFGQCWSWHTSISDLLKYAAAWTELEERHQGSQHHWLSANMKGIRLTILIFEISFYFSLGISFPPWVFPTFRQLSSTDTWLLNFKTGTLWGWEWGHTAFHGVSKLRQTVIGIWECKCVEKSQMPREGMDIREHWASMSHALSPWAEVGKQGLKRYRTSGPWPPIQASPRTERHPSGRLTDISGQ